MEHRGLGHIPIAPLLQWELFVLPAGKVAKAGYLHQVADGGNKPPQVLGSGFYQHALISCSFYMSIKGQLTNSDLCDLFPCRTQGDQQPLSGMILETMEEQGENSGWFAINN